MSARPGAALLELVTASVLLAIVCSICTALLHAQAALIRNTSEHIAVDETIRSARTIMTSELRALTPADFHAMARDSIAMRIFRGLGIVCDYSAGRLLVRYQGLRLPDFTKDSILVFGEHRTGTFAGVTETNAGCPPRPDEQILIISSSMPIRPGAVLLFYETGAYHLSAKALRYRRGLEGRQPLTDERIDHRRSSFQFASRGRGVRLNMRSVPAVGAPARESNTHVRFLNQSQ